MLCGRQRPAVVTCPVVDKHPTGACSVVDKDLLWPCGASSIVHVLLVWCLPRHIHLLWTKQLNKPSSPVLAKHALQVVDQTIK